MTDGTCVEKVVVIGADRIDGTEARGAEVSSFADLVADRPTASVPEIEDHAALSYLYTSGTTSAPKGVVNIRPQGPTHAEGS